MQYKCYRLEATERSIRRARGSVLDEADADNLLHSFTDIINEFQKGQTNAHNKDKSKYFLFSFIWMFCKGGKASHSSCRYTCTCRVQTHDVLFSVAATGYKAKRTERTGGAPRFAITRLQLQVLVQCGFPMPRMSKQLGVSLKTVKRRIRWK